MRRILTTLAVMALATLGLLAVSPSASSATPPAPLCDSGASRFDCSGTGPGPLTWTITVYQGVFPTTYTTTTTGGVVVGACHGRSIVRLYYTSSAGTSSSTSFVCNPGDWP